MCRSKTSTAKASSWGSVRIHEVIVVWYKVLENVNLCGVVEHHIKYHTHVALMNLVDQILEFFDSQFRVLRVFGVHAG